MVDSLEEAVSGTQLVVEMVSEKRPVKIAVYKKDSAVQV
jgi:hypothetical protein